MPARKLPDLDDADEWYALVFEVAEQIQWDAKMNGEDLEMHTCLSLANERLRRPIRDDDGPTE